MSDIIYYVFGVLAIIYLAILFKNRRGSRNRKSRKFMDGKRRHKDS
ncbi:hypothetical protein HME9304_00363 [Flagellimonas maritima]|uniref:Uncharacterized protein n=1 Tax=Flagellimonas maritima TaxID=1383885 RepID=A0A2Z4LNE0_9FLAO|nr:hypothetical protein [Allomuricauda aurantiaca]AWX43375.1 hypothetical protein HME9304_00363 [Allomuricauda aurantiaca]